MYERILVGTDGSDPARQALEHAIELAAEVGATVHVLTVVEPASGPVSFGVDTVSAIDDAATDLIDQLVSEVATHDVELTGDVRRGHPATEIERYALEVDIDLIVVGQRGTHTFAESLLGSTTDRLARSVPIPLLVIPEANEVER